MVSYLINICFLANWYLLWLSQWPISSTTLKMFFFWLDGSRGFKSSKFKNIKWVWFKLEKDELGMEISSSKLKIKQISKELGTIDFVWACIESCFRFFTQIRLTLKFEITTYISNINHNLQKHSIVLRRGISQYCSRNSRYILEVREWFLDIIVRWNGFLG